jgi:inner membrane protein YidH
VSSPAPGQPDRRWPRRVYGQGDEPDPRFSFANERTFLAWIRTALGFLAAGVAIAAVARLNNKLGLEVRLGSVLLIICGALCGLNAMTRWMRNERAMRLNVALPSSLLMPLLSGVLALVAVVAFLVVSFE